MGNHGRFQYGSREEEAVIRAFTVASINPQSARIRRPPGRDPPPPHLTHQPTPGRPRLPALASRRLCPGLPAPLQLSQLIACPGFLRPVTTPPRSQVRASAQSAAGTSRLRAPGQLGAGRLPSPVTAESQSTLPGSMRRSIGGS